MLTDGDRFRVGHDLLGETAENRIELEQVRHRLQVTEIVHGDDLKACSTLERRAQEVSADPPEAVNGDACHRLGSWRRPCRCAIGPRPHLECHEESPGRVGPSARRNARRAGRAAKWGRDPMTHRSHAGDPSDKGRCTMEVLETYTSVLAVLSGAFLLVAAGLAKKQLAWKRPATVRARCRRRSS
jgi:hypothetical protein